MTTALLITAFVISTCGLVYELIAGTVASYLLGDSITQFSTVIGVYLFSMGIGSYLSRFVEKNIAFELKSICLESARFNLYKSFCHLMDLFYH